MYFVHIADKLGLASYYPFNPLLNKVNCAN